MRLAQDVIWSTGKRSSLRPWEQLLAFLYLLPVAFLQPLWFALMFRFINHSPFRGNVCKLGLYFALFKKIFWCLEGCQACVENQRRNIIFGLTFLSLRNLLVLISVNNQVTRKGLRWNASNGGKVFKRPPLDEVVTLKGEKKELVYVSCNSWPPNKTQHS